MHIVGETGAIPVRARRREVHKTVLFLTLWVAQRGKAIEAYRFEKVKKRRTAVEISNGVYSSGCESQPLRGKIFHKGVFKMKTNAKKIKSVLSFVLCAVLVATLAFSVTGCKLGDPSKAETPTSVSSVTTAPATVVKGEGNTVFTFEVTDQNKNFTQFEIHTNKETVGEALQELGLIAGEEGQYGLYVKTVNGVTLDYDKDGLYWAFYENGQYASKGIDQTPIDTGTIYELKAAK